jgi:ParB family chromosome partitioning protein
VFLEHLKIFYGGFFMTTNRAIRPNSAVIYLSVDTIRPNPYQPRKFFEQNSLEELSKSIKMHGVMQPISVRLVNGCEYELVAGERRLRASKMAGLISIPAVIITLSAEDSALLALIENMQRQNLNFLEEAEGFYNLMRDYHFTQEALAEKIGKSQSAVANKMRILRLPKTVQSRLIENELTERHARALLRLPDETAQLDVLDKIIKGALNVKRTEDLVETYLQVGEMATTKATNPKKRFVRDIKIFTNTVQQAVDIMNRSGVQADYDTQEHASGCDIIIHIKY